MVKVSINLPNPSIIKTDDEQKVTPTTMNYKKYRSLVKNLILATLFHWNIALEFTEKYTLIRYSN